MIAQQILLGEPARALPIGAEKDWNVVVDDDRERGSHDGTRMRARTIRTAQEIIQTGFHDYAGAVVFSELQKLSSETVSVADDRMNKVLGCLSLYRDFVLQTGEGVVPRR